MTDPACGGAVAAAQARLEIAWRGLTDLFGTTPEALPAWDAWRTANAALMDRLRAEPVLMSAWRTWLLAEAELFRAEDAPRAQRP